MCSPTKITFGQKCAASFQSGKCWLRKGIAGTPLAAAMLLTVTAASAAPVIADYGDAPDTYQTLYSSGGPYHLNTSFEWIGSMAADTEADGQPSNKAIGENVSGTYDEDFQIPFMITPGTTNVTIKLGVIDHSSGRYGASAGQLMYLEGWIDYDHGGTFQSALGANEQFVRMAIDASLWGSNTKGFDVSFAVPAGQFGPEPETYGRLRLNYGQGFLGYTGAAAFGEVEDFALTQACPPVLPEPPSVALVGVAMAGLIRFTLRRTAATAA